MPKISFRNIIPIIIITMTILGISLYFILKSQLNTSSLPTSTPTPPTSAPITIAPTIAPTTAAPIPTTPPPTSPPVVLLNNKGAIVSSVNKNIVWPTNLVKPVEVKFKFKYTEDPVSYGCLMDCQNHSKLYAGWKINFWGTRKSLVMYIGSAYAGITFNEPLYNYKIVILRPFMVLNRRKFLDVKLIKLIIWY